MDLKQREEKVFFHTYKRLSLEPERGEGVFLFTHSGEKYLDMIGGLAVNVLGYNHPKIEEAIINQYEKYQHLSNLFLQEPQIEFAEMLTKLSGFDRVFLCSTGTEAIEGAIKLIRKFSKGKNKTELISFSGGFHGRTYGALSLTHKEKYRKDHDPFLPEVKNLKYNSIEELEKNTNEKTAAVFLEFIQGEGGVVSASNDFISKLMELKKKFNFLVIADCIQDGAGRTGKFISIQHYDAEVDICVLAKGIGGGLPLGAILGKEFLNDCWKTGEHGTTFGGNPIACAAGIAVFKELQNEVMSNAAVTGDFLMTNLDELKKKFPSVIDAVRGKGLMIGIQISNGHAQTIVEKLFGKKILVNLTNENVIRLLPPLIISESECRDFLAAFEKVIEDLNSSQV